VTDERIKDRIEWVHDGLLGWLRSIYGLQGLNLNVDVYKNTAPQQSQINRLSHHWVVLGNLMWERAELSLYQNAPNLGNWTNVREFQRDIMTWVKVWHDCTYHPPHAVHPVRMSSLLNLLITCLHACTGSVEVAVVDPNDELINVWVRLKNYPHAYACMISMPKLTGNAF
jgi:hypothetical protein